MGMQTTPVNVRSADELGAILRQAQTGELSQDSVPLLEIDAHLLGAGARSTVRRA